MKAIERDVGKIYVVVNNAGGVSTRPFHMETIERFWYQVELNFKAVRDPVLSHLSGPCRIYWTFCFV